MLKRILALLISITVCGCAAGTPKVDQGPALGPVRDAHRIYAVCLKQQVKPYLETAAKPKDIAGTVAEKCEPKLSRYKVAVREVFATQLSPDSDGYAYLLMSKPEIHANRVREKGRQVTIARVLKARKLAKAGDNRALAGEANAKMSLNRDKGSKRLAAE